jgi:hypothetical protein
MQVQLHVELQDVVPRVWRRVVVPESVTLARLHVVLQWAMGWTNSHLHEYQVGTKRYGMADPEWLDDDPPVDERRVKLKTLVQAGVRRFVYQYDFGDGWDHTVTVEDLLHPESPGRRIRCLAGENACPPEDVGGSSGYADFLEAIADPSHEEHEACLTWVGYPFDPAAFDINAVNQRLQQIRP